jgi:hypothetical protein
MGIFINLKLKFKTGYLLPIRTKSTSCNIDFTFLFHHTIVQMEIIRVIQTSLSNYRGNATFLHDFTVAYTY